MATGAVGRFSLLISLMAGLLAAGAAVGEPVMRHSMIARPQAAATIHHSPSLHDRHLRTAPWVFYSHALYGSDARPDASSSSNADDTPVARNSTYGPIIRRDTCSPKVYLIDPDGSVQSFCGQEPGLR